MRTPPQFSPPECVALSVSPTMSPPRRRSIPPYGPSPIPLEAFVPTMLFAIAAASANPLGRRRREAKFAEGSKGGRPDLFTSLILSQKVCAGRIRTNVPTPGYNIQSLFRILPQHTVALRCAESLELPQNGFLRGNQACVRQLDILPCRYQTRRTYHCR